MEWKYRFYSKNKVLILILLLFFVFRLLILFNSKQSFYSDDAIYAEIARFWTQGKWSQVFHPTWPPLYPAFSALFYLVVRNWEISLRLVSIFFFVLFLIPIFYLAERTISRTAAIVITLFIGVMTQLLKISVYPQSDMLATSLVISSVVLVFFALEKSSSKLLLISSLLLGTTFLVRAEGTLFFSLTFSFLSFYFLAQLLQKKQSLKKVLFTIFGFIIIFFITASPYVIATSNQLGRATMSQKFSAQMKQGHAFQIKENGTTWSQEVVSAKYPNYNSEYFKGGFGYFLENIDWFLFWFGQKYKLWINVFLSVFPAFSLIFIAIGTIRLGRKHFWGVSYLVYLLTLGAVITIFSTPLADIRYLLWTIPFLLIFFFAGFGRMQYIGIVALLLFPSFDLSLVLNPIGYAIDYTNQYYRGEIIEASNWIIKNSKRSEPRIMMRHENVEFYTDGVTIYLPQELNSNQMLSYAQENKVDYLVAWQETLANDANLAFLLNENSNPIGLKKVYSTTSTPRKLILYEVLY